MLNSRLSTRVMQNPFLWLTVGVCSVLLIPALFMGGMFSDGILYSSVSKNYALGLGTFWEPVYGTTSLSSFHEQPPLMFFLQGTFFKIFGCGIYAERIYCLIAALINSFLIYRCWKIIHPSGKTGWLPVLFWFTMPVTFYAFINNLEECTMSIFVLAAMAHLLHALHRQRNNTFHLLFASCMILLAGLTKGFQGMFLLSAPFIWWLCNRSNSFHTMIRQCFLLATIPALFVAYAMITLDVYDSFEAYFNARLFPTFNHAHDTSGSRFHILYELLLDSLYLIFMLVLLLFASKGKSGVLAGWNQHKGLISFFLLISAAGILPLMITLEQRDFYIVTALPFIAIAAALFVAPQMERIIESLSHRRKLSALIGYFGILVTIGAIVSSIILAGKPKRNDEKLHDLVLIVLQTGEHKSILTNAKRYADKGFCNYFMPEHGT